MITRWMPRISLLMAVALTVAGAATLVVDRAAASCDGPASALGPAPRNAQPLPCMIPPPLGESSSTSQPEAPVDRYRAHSGEYSYWDGAQLVPDPSYIPDDELHVYGADISFFEGGEGLAEGGTCQKRFCLNFSVRYAGNWSVDYTYEYTGVDSSTGYEYACCAYGRGSLAIDAGRPVVTGGGKTVHQSAATLATCEVWAFMWVNESVGGQVDRRTEAFSCE